MSTLKHDIGAAAAIYINIRAMVNIVIFLTRPETA